MNLVLIEDLDPTSVFLLMTALVLFAILAVFSVWALVLQISIFFRYTSNNKKHIGGKTARQVAREMLDNFGYHDIRVERASYFWFIFFRSWGNRYSPRRKAIFLYRNILDKDTVTAVALACQKVGLVVQHKEGNKQMAFRARWEIWTRMAPNLFLPITIFGLLLDLIFNSWSLEGNLFGLFTLVFAVLAMIYTIIAFRALWLIIPTEKRAGQIALEAIERFDLIPEQHRLSVKQMFDTYVTKYIVDFVLAIIELLIDIVRIALAINEHRK